MTPTLPFDVIVCGSLHLDIVVQAPVLPRIDETAVGHAWGQVCGGKGGNQAVQAARAGAHTAMLGHVGADDFGRTLLANLEAKGVDVSGVGTDRQKGSGMSVAILQDDGDYGAVIVSGANLTLDAGALRDHWLRWGGARVLILQNEVPAAINAAMARLAHEAGATVILNAAPARALQSDLLDHVNVLVVNRVEAEALCGEAVANRAAARRAIATLAGPSRAAIITLGGEGVVVADLNGSITEIAPVPVRVSSTHGAGDCFVGVLAAGLAKGQALVPAARAANAKAAAFVAGTLD